MTGLLAWGITAVALLAAALVIGQLARGTVLGILIDTRGRYSLTQLQIVSWTVVVLSLFVAIFWVRLTGRVPEPLEFEIPAEVLAVLGISGGSAVVSTAVKAGKDAAHPERVAASNASDKPRFSQVFLVEEGDLADRVVDVTKFQNFWITIALLSAYVAQGVALFAGVEAASAIGGLPPFGATFVTLLAISHAAYLAGKVPNQSGVPDGLTVLLRRQHAVVAPAGAAVAPGAVRAPAIPAPAIPASAVPAPAVPAYVPRNPG